MILFQVHKLQHKGNSSLMIPHVSVENWASRLECQRESAFLLNCCYKELVSEAKIHKGIIYKMCPPEFDTTETAVHICCAR